MPSLGTLAWLNDTGGRLGRLDRLRMAGQAIRAKAAARLKGRQLEIIRHIELDAITPPDSAVARAAEALCIEASAPWLYHHALRAWYWGRLLDDGRTRFDEEAVYVAFLLHDLGLTDGFRLKGGAVQCFTYPGAHEAGRIARAHGWSDARADLAANAISLHLNILVGAEHGREAQIVRSGAGADIIGQNVARIPADLREVVLERHPRLDFKKKVDQVIRIEVENRPCCRMAFMHGSLGFDRLIANAPFQN